MRLFSAYLPTPWVHAYGSVKDTGGSILGWILAGPFIGAAAYLAFMIPFGVGISVLALFFGPEYAASVFSYDVSVETAPSGLWNINQLSTRLAELHRSGLAHSTPEDERVPVCIADWILKSNFSTDTDGRISRATEEGHS
jgi:hypothetical protein